MADARTKRLTLIACVLGSAVVFVDGTVVNVALPAIRDDLDTGLAAQQWIVEAYLLTLGSLLLVGGSLGDRLGRRKVFMAGLAGFGATSALCAIAPSAELLVAFRAIQGVAGALLVPSSLALITSTFGPDERGAAIGTWTAWTGILFVAGPLAGGTVIQFASWRWIFAINVPLVLATLVLARRVPESRDGAMEGRIGYLGAGLASLGVEGGRDRLPGRVRGFAGVARPGLRADQPAAVRRGGPAGLRPADRRAGAARRVRGARGAHAAPDAPARAVPRAQLRGRQPRD